MSAPSQAMRATLRGYWTGAAGYQKFLYCVGALLLLSAVFHTGVLLATRGTLAGDVSWRKPILFGESFGVTAISIAWVMTFLPKWRAAGWLLAVMLGLANAGEVFLVAMQQWRGVPSHFNNATQFDTAVFTLMGVLILFTGVVIAVVALATLFPLRAPASLAWAIRAGMALLVASQLVGLQMIRHDSNTFGAAGLMKLPHALALHGLQVLPALAWLLLFARWSETRRAAAVFVAAAGYAGVVAVTAFQAFQGRAPLDLDLPAALAVAMSFLALVAACAAALLGLRQSAAVPSRASS